LLVDELPIPSAVKELLREQGYETLHPPQAEALPLALSGKSVVVSIPTASGKSLIGYLAALRTVLELGRRVLYIVPLKALAAEKRDDLAAFSALGWRVAMSTGDLDAEELALKDADVVVATSEKADSLLRHGHPFMSDLGLVIADEVHLIHDPGRGPTLEVALTKMKRRNPEMQIIALSATISNAADLADWMDAELVTSDWRPVPLRQAVHIDGELRFSDGGRAEVEGDGEPLWNLIAEAVRQGGQCLVFVNSRRSTESLASKYSKSMGPLAGQTLTREEKAILEGEGESTSIGRRLAACVSGGMAFHHAGLSHAQRKMVEDRFKEGLVKCIVATPTLAAGINLPARRVIVRDTSRFESNAGFVPISVMEIRQMCGRAGRPRFDPYGEAVLMARSEDDAWRLMDDYFYGDAEDIISKLGTEALLRSHVLGLLATGDASSRRDIMLFLEETFYGHQSALYGLEGAVDNIVELLLEHEMASEEAGILRPTWFGKRVSDLYIDPQSALILRQALESWRDDVPDLAILQVLCSTPDVMSLYLRKSDVEWVDARMADMDGSFLIPPPDDSYEYDFFLADFKAACLLESWMNEDDEDGMLTFFSVGPGDLRNRSDSAEWILYSMSELAKRFRPEAGERLSLLLTRMRHGVREELIDLVRLRGIGRFRARLLYNAGYHDRTALKNANPADLARLPKMGPTLVSSIMSQLGRAAPANLPEAAPVSEPEEEEDADSRQSSLFDF